MDLNLENKKALVFGSSSGLGKAIAESLLGEKTTVCLASRSLENLKKTADQIGTTLFVEADLSKPQHATEACTKAIQKMKQIDIMVMNTGGPAKGSFLDISLHQWNQDFQSLWLSFVEALHVVLPGMKERKFGRILIVTSIAAKEPLPNLTTSNGLRAGLEGLCKSLSMELAAYNITVNILRPGYTNTDRLKELKLSEEKVKQLVPMERLGNPQELADLATFLCSPRAAYVTGQSIAIDGGVTRGH